MSLTKRFAIWGCVAGTLAMLAWPTPADAQRRRGAQQGSRAVPRSSAGAGARTGARVGVRYGPRFGSYYPYRYGWSPYGPYYGQYYGFPYYGQYYGSPYYYGERGSLRIEVKPEETEVYVDGYYVGVVDSYDGFFQRLHLPPGAHEIELRLEGYHSIREELYLTIGSTYRIKHEMEPLGPGETTSPPPIPPAPPENLPPPGEPPLGPGGAAPPLTQVSGFGTLAIRVQPDDAVILVDGEEWRSPGAGRVEVELGVGRHRVEVRRDGYDSYVTDVDVQPGDVTQVNISLPRREEGR